MAQNRTLKIETSYMGLISIGLLVLGLIFIVVGLFLATYRYSTYYEGILQWPQFPYEIQGFLVSFLSIPILIVAYILKGISKKP